MALMIEDDIGLANQWKLEWGAGKHKVKFQFPPIIESDGRSADWKKVALPWRTPLAIFAKPSGRELTLKWVYIVDGEWTTKRVAAQVSAVKAYFGDTGGKARDFMITGAFVLHGGAPQGLTFLATSCSVKHGETYIIPKIRDTSDYKNAYPLVSEISMSIESWTRGVPRDGKGAERASEAKKEEDGNVTQEIDDLTKNIPTGWF